MTKPSITNSYDVRALKLSIISEYKQDALSRLLAKTSPLYKYPAKTDYRLIFALDKRIYAIAILSHSLNSQRSIIKYGLHGLTPDQHCELQFFWVSDYLGKNAASHLLSRVISYLKHDTKVKVISATVNDHLSNRGVILQANSWLYLGNEAVKDFYLTDSKHYKSLANARNFATLSGKYADALTLGKQLFGAGQVLNTYKYYYLYPVKRSLRKRFNKFALPYPK